MDKRPGPEQRFRGRVLRIDNNTAYVLLTDSEGRKLSVGFDAGLLKVHGIHEGAEFLYTIKKRGNRTRRTLGAIPPQPLTEEDSRELWRQLEETLGDYSGEDDTTPACEHFERGGDMPGTGGKE